MKTPPNLTGLQAHRSAQADPGAMRQVKSAGIKAIGYDQATKEMRVEFSSGGTYTLSDVSADKHSALMSAKSIGSHFAANFRGQHQHRKA